MGSASAPNRKVNLGQVAGERRILDAPFLFKSGSDLFAAAAAIVAIPISSSNSRPQPLILEAGLGCTFNSREAALSRRLVFLQQVNSASVRRCELAARSEPPVVYQ